MTSDPGEVRTVRSSAARLVRIPTALAAVGIWAWLALPSALGGPLGLIWVSGTSMEPTLRSGDVAMVYRADAYQVGDVIAFEAPEGGTVIHRIVEVDDRGYVPQGDNRSRPDLWRPADDDIVGRMVLRLPGAGNLLLRLRSPVVLGALTTLLVFGLLLRRPRPADGDAVGPET